MSIELKNVSSGYSTGIINENFQTLEDALNSNFLRRQAVEAGDANQMELPLDMNNNPILNIATDVDDGGSLITVGEADLRYVNVTGDSMSGELNMGGNPLRVREPVDANEPARKSGLDSESQLRQSGDAQLRLDFQAADNLIEDGYQAGDAALQAQINESAPMPSVERPIIQWHGQLIENSITIPDSVNAFTTGPSVAIAQGQQVTVGTDSFWTIVNGVDSGSVVTSPLNNFDEGTL